MLLFAIAAYIGAQFAIGIWASRRVRTEADYLIAGRRLGYPLAVFSIFGTWFGAETVMSASGRAYADGLSLTSAEPFGYALCLLLLGLVFAAPLWRAGLTTLADLYRQRYSPGVERLAALLLIPPSLLWAAAQMRAFGQVLSHASALPVDAAVLVAAAVCVAYTAFGGLLADAVTDLVQGGLLVLGLVAVLIAVMSRLGGPAELASAVVASPRLVSPGTGQGLLASLEAWSVPVLGSLIASETVTRVIAARSSTVARRSALLAGGLYLAVGLIPVTLAVAAAPLVATPADPEQFLPALARAALPTLGYVVFAGAIISAILSTVDSTLLVSSGLLSHNLLVPLLRVSAEAARVRLARLGVLAFGVTAYLLARHATGVYDLVESASAFAGGGVLVSVSFALFTRWGTARAAYATLATGLITSAAGELLGLPYPYLTSTALSLAAYVGVAALE